MSVPKNEDTPIDTTHAYTADFHWNGNASGWDEVHSYQKVQPKEDLKVYPIARKHDSTTGWHFKMSKTFIRIEGSLPRLVSSNNSQPLHSSDFPVILSYLEESKARLGLEFDPATLRIARIDIFRQLCLPYPASQFIKQLSQIHRLPHLVQRASSEFYRFSYVRWENRSREIVLYDKTASFRTGDLLKDNYIVRAEVRFLKPHICLREGIIDLYSLTDAQHLHQLWFEQFRQLLEKSKQLGLGDPSTFKGDIANILKNIIQTHGFRVSQLVTTICSIGGIDKVLEYLGSEEGFNLWLKTLEIHRQKRARIRNTIQKLIGISNQFREPPLKVDAWADLEDWVKMR